MSYTPRRDFDKGGRGGGGGEDGGYDVFMKAKGRRMYSSFPYYCPSDI